MSKPLTSLVPIEMNTRCYEFSISLAFPPPPPKFLFILPCDLRFLVTRMKCDIKLAEPFGLSADSEFPFSEEKFKLDD